MGIEQRRFDRAIADFDAALKLEPKSISALAAKADLLATCPESSTRDGKTALELATRAVEACKSPDGRALAALAAARAELGQFPEAIAAQQSANSLKGYQVILGEEGKKRLRNYENKRAWRADQ
jgi:tetratricopeptide (TPR) repeat protein